MFIALLSVLLVTGLSVIAAPNSKSILLAGQSTSSITKRAVVDCDDTRKKQQITDSYLEAKELAHLAWYYIQQHGADDLYDDYWGAFTPTANIQSVYAGVANENRAATKLTCNSDPLGNCAKGAIAYTDMTTKNIYFCDPFFHEVPSANLCHGAGLDDIRGGTTLHESTHVLFNTEDPVYGCAAIRGRVNDPDNADSYNCFAIEVYERVKCH
ncbi:hypothetical protein F5146DRAFT_67609 [Armillaria mellea]|nr:hypothetical protein F5146DRAFT_229835 [Armillaria mellea]KAK0198012.1 hypothetical protein F5146DRAFT_67609 [Armillaria mellea]